MKTRRILALAMALTLLMSLGAYASGMPDTSMGGRATSAPPDNSTRAVDVLGSRAALYIEYGDDGYTLAENVTDAYDAVLPDDLAAPAEGEDYALEGIYIDCARVDWDEENTVGNSGIVINARTDEQTLFSLGGEQDVYEAPDGQRYNSVIVMRYDEDETLPDSAKETAPGVGLAFNGKSISLNNVYIESNSTGRPSVHIPSKSRDKNATQLPDLICSDSTFINHDTRALLLMGGNVWFLNSQVLTNAWGGLSYDNTSTTMYVVNSDVENIGDGGYALYDAAGCTTHIYGSRLIGGNVGVTVCRNAVLYVDALDAAPSEATEPYTGVGSLTTPAVTEDGRTVIAAYDQPIMMHADMSGPDSQAVAEITGAYISTMGEDVTFADGTDWRDWDKENTGVSKLLNDYQSGACAIIRSHNGKLIFDDCELVSRTGIAVHSQFIYDSMASGIYPVDGTEYVGDEVVFRNMTVDGDVLHEDYMRKMNLSLESATLNGAVVGTTLAAWNSYWRDQIAALDESELSDASGEMTAEEVSLQKFIYNDSYDTVWGVRMNIDADSVWNVTGTSNLYSLTVADPDSIRGEGLEIYIDCAMSNDAMAYDISTGTKIDALEAGKTYEGVVIVVDEADEVLSLDIDGATVENGKLELDLGLLLKLFGLDVSYDEQTGVASVNDKNGVLRAVLEDSLS